MATFVVMDHTGDSRQYFQADDSEALAWAEARFNELTSHGYTAATRTGTGEALIVKSLDPTAEETLFYPRLVGG
jgi:hypothetical protein